MDLMKPNGYKQYLIKIGAVQPVKKTAKNIDPKLIESAKRLLGERPDTFVSSVPKKKGRKDNFHRLNKAVLK